MKKIFLVLTLFVLCLSALVIRLINVNAINSPISHKAEVVSETVTFEGNQVEATGFIAYNDESGNMVIKSVGDASSVTIDTNLETNEKLKTIFKQIEDAESLSIFNSKLDSVAQSINKDYNASVFVVTDLFELTISNELKQLLNSNDDYYYSIKLSLETSSNSKPVVMHQNEETGEWIIVDSENISVESDGVSIKFDSLCPVMVLTVDEGGVNENAKMVPWGIIAVLSFVLLMLIIFMIATFARKKKYSK